MNQLYPHLLPSFIITSLLRFLTDEKPGTEDENSMRCSGSQASGHPVLGPNPTTHMQRSTVAIKTVFMLKLTAKLYQH